jgi:hypothetical protein
MKKLKYLELMEDNDVQLSDLPKDIRTKINALKPTIARYNMSNPPSGKLEEAIIKQDIGIAEMIADFIEKDLPDAPEENEITEEVKDENNGEVVANVNPTPVVIEEPIVVAPVIETRVRKYKDGTLEQEKEILLECQNNNGFIESEKLGRILGKSNWSLSLSTEEVYSIQLRKVYSKSLYKLIS